MAKTLKVKLVRKDVVKMEFSKRIKHARKDNPKLLKVIDQIVDEYILNTYDLHEKEADNHIAKLKKMLERHV